MAPGRHYEFGPFRLDPAGGVFRDGKRLALTPKAVEVLTLLVEARGNAIAKEELLQRVWADTVVEEGSLTSHISILRKSLGEGQDGREFIETIPKRGYRFAAPVNVVEKGPAGTATQAFRKRFVLWTLAGLVMASLAVLAALNVGGFRDRLRANTAAVPVIRSLAVLSLENLSKDPEQEYFADGMTEELTTELAQISSLKVISHTSVVQYKGTKKSLPQIARELGVDAVVEGAVQRSGDRVEITVQLIQAPSDRHLWAKSYQRALRDVLDLQREVTHSIIDEIRAKLTSQETARLASARSINSEAYEDYLQGHFLLWGQGEGDARHRVFSTGDSKEPELCASLCGPRRVLYHLGPTLERRPIPKGGPPPSESGSEQGIGH